MATPLQAGADIHLQNSDSSTPLHLAATNARLESVHALLAAGAQVDQTDCLGYSPLHEAARVGCQPAVSALLRAGADVHLQSGPGETALHLAAGTGSLESVQALLAAGAEPDQAYQPCMSPPAYTTHSSDKLMSDPHNLGAFTSVVRLAVAGTLQNPIIDKAR